MSQKLRTALGAAAVVACAAAVAMPAGAAAAASGAGQATSARAQLAALAEQDVRAGAPGVIVQVREHGKPVITITRQAAFTRTGRCRRMMSSGWDPTPRRWSRC